MRGSLLCLILALPSVAPAQDLSRFDRAKAEWLLRERLPCLGCHRLEGKGGSIGPDLTGVADRRSAGFIFRMITAPQTTLQGSHMPRVPMPADWARLIASYLAAPRTSPAAPADAAAAGDTAPLREIEDGAELYRSLCSACHGATGAGDGFNAGNLPVRPTAHADSGYMSSRPDDTLFDGVYAGGYILDKSPLMPAWGETLSREQIWGLVRYLRELCRCAGPEWSRR